MKFFAVSLTLLSFLLPQTHCQWQTDTIFFNKKWKQCYSEDASYYRIITIDTAHIYFLVQDYYMSGQIQMKGAYRSINPDVKTGEFFYWYKNGRPWVECSYENGIFNGTYREWFENGQLKSECFYKKGVLDGLEKNWNENGVLTKQIEYRDGRKNGKFITFYGNGQPVRKDIYRDDRLVRGHCFTPDGKDTAYFDYFTMPQFMGGLSGFKNFISEKLIFPDTAKINNEEGLVKVKFTIDKEGNVTNINVVEEDKEYFNKEAIRVVKELPKWVPGRRDGREIEVTLTVPIYFKLK